ncbi:MAG: TonB-dependent receptor domain-containing protein [Bryobacteraceae bacterium]
MTGRNRSPPPSVKRRQKVFFEVIEVRSAIALLLMLLVSNDIPAQTPAGTGTIAGTVRDPYGEGLPDTTVVIVNEPLGIHRRTETSAEGVFHAPALPPAAGYRLKVARKGYGGWESGSLQVSADQELTVDVTLPEEAEAAKVGASAQLRPDGGRFGPAASLTRLQIDALPMRERRVESLVQLAPAVNLDLGRGLSQLCATPTPPPSFLDGLATGDHLFVGGSRQTPQIPPEAAQDVRILPSAYAAELGGSMGGLVGIATRRGGNEFHGALYDYFRNRGLTAANSYALGRNLTRWRHDGGASFSGPVLRNKVYLFSNFELLKNRGYGLNRITNPVLVHEAGLSVLASTCTATPSQCEAAVRYLSGQMNVEVPRSENSTSGILRLDYRLGEWDTLSFQAGATGVKWPGGSAPEKVAPGGGLLGLGSMSMESSFGRLNWTAAGPSATNQLSLGTFRERLSIGPASPALPAGGLSISLAGADVGTAQPYAFSIRDVHRNQIGDNLSVTRGLHVVRLGVSFSENPNWITELKNGSGFYTYSSLTSFAQDLAGGGGKNYALFRQAFGPPGRKFRTRDLSLYAQDTWRLRPGLTVNLGLRYEKTFLPQPAEADANFYRTGIIPSPSLAGSPRIGIAYKLDDRTVARFGFGFFYSPFDTGLIDALLLGNGLYQANLTVNRTYTAAPAFPNVVASLSSMPAGTKDLIWAAAKFRNPYSVQSTLTLDRQLTEDASVSLGFISAPGRQLLTAQDTNLVKPATSKTYIVLDANGQTVGTWATDIFTSRATTDKSRLYEISNGGASSYSALVLQFTQRMPGGVSVQASYTLSHAISNTGGPWLVPSVPLSSYSGKPAEDRGDAASDQRHRATVNWIWQPTVTRSSSRLARYLLNGWQHSAIVTIGSAQPVTALVLPVGQQFSGTTMLYTTSLNGSGGWARVPFQSVGSLRTGAPRNIDIRVARPVPITERLSAKLLFEVFNLFNNQFATGLNTTAYTATGGTLKPVSGAGTATTGAAPRSAQVGLKLEF